MWWCLLECALVLPFPTKQSNWPHKCNQLHYLYLIWLICFVLFIHAVMSNKKTLLLNLNIPYLCKQFSYNTTYFILCHGYFKWEHLIIPTWILSICRNYILWTMAKEEKVLIGNTVLLEIWLFNFCYLCKIDHHQKLTISGNEEWYWWKVQVNTMN